MAAEASLAPMHAVVHGHGHAAQVNQSGFTALLKRCPVLRPRFSFIRTASWRRFSQAVVCNTATPEHVAATLGVLRLSVNQAATEFQDAGLISYSRGKIRIVSRCDLKGRACACYAMTDRIFREALQ